MTLLRLFAILFGLLAISNLIKPIESTDMGFVFLGTRLSGLPNVVAAWTFAAYLAAYAAAIWRERSIALPMGIAYAGYVVANLIFFEARTGAMSEGLAFGLMYSVVAIGVSWGAVALMLREGFAEKDAAAGRVVLRSFALLFALMAFSNFMKVFAYSDTAGFVLLGQRLTGTANVAATLTFAAFLAYYAYCVWSEKRPAVALGAFYALYVLANLVLWTYRKPDGAERPLFFLVSYTVGAVGVSGGAALLLQKYKDRYA
jgi:hypothetical protein